ncbi:MAG: type II toxin-antitoxin system VapC family toxin [Verrucomicrobiota bacterium]
MKKACFDTSALVAALLQQHPCHARAFPRLLEVQQGTLHGVMTTHGLAELFATLTALPLKPRLPPVDVQRMLQQSVLARFEVVPLTAKHSSEALALTVHRGLGSGAIYDALHLVGARAAQCDELLTFNGRHFEALAPGDPLIVQP